VIPASQSGTIAQKMPAPAGKTTAGKRAIFAPESN
jgi:hypothetical protein